MGKIICLFLVVGIVYIVGFCMGCAWIFKRNYAFTKDQCKRGDKFWRMFQAVHFWLDIKEDGKDIAHYFRERNYSHIAVYGIGYLGKHLVKELRKSDIRIDYIVDKNTKEIEENIALYAPDVFLPETEAMVVTAIMDFNEIAEAMGEKLVCPILSLEEVIFEVNNEIQNDLNR